jgi:DNA-binding transcriptional MerR regulator/quercetin dioxygenase-like cupin family protein
MPDNAKQPRGERGLRVGKAMAYTVKQVAGMSGVSVRTLHFYDETGLLKPAYVGANGYRFYEEAQLLTLQQILFYRELGFELKQIRRILGRADFEKMAALQSHREVLQKNLARTRTLIETVDKTLKHLKGTKKMKSEEMFRGFSVAAGKDRFDEHIRLGGEPNDCKVSAQDTDGAMCVFEFNGTGGGPRHRHHEQDEWIYVLEGEFVFYVGDEQFRAGPGELVFIPRKVPHAWAVVNDKPGKIINTYQPAGKMEEFFREVGTYHRNGKPQIHEALSLEELRRLFQDHGMDLLAPPVGGKWKVDEDGRIVQLA